MKLTKRMLPTLLAAAAIGAIGLSVPKGAHALAAALVQVTNTWSNPAVTIDPSKAASQQILLQTSGGVTLDQGQQTTMALLSPTAGMPNPSGYVVPAGQRLVVTGVELVLYSNLTSPAFLRINESSGSYAYEYFNQLNAGMHQFSFPQGIVYPPGSFVSFDNTDGNANMEVIVRGYLTAL